ncbi:MAG: hypothetical protein ACI30V_00360 [Muribaculaceae bacterium]
MSELRSRNANLSRRLPDMHIVRNVEVRMRHRNNM